MDYLILSGDTIANIIVCADEETAAQFGAVPSYEGARIGDVYAPPEPEPEPEPEPTPEEKTMAAVVRLARMQAQALPDAQALEVPELYEGWAPDTAYSVQHIVSRPDGHLYRCQQGHTSQEGWEPENTPALWVVIANGEAGTQEDPITAARGMEYQYGLYYQDPEDGKVYLCERIGEAEGGKIVLQYLPHELVGQYFTAAQS